MIYIKIILLAFTLLISNSIHSFGIKSPNFIHNGTLSSSNITINAGLFEGRGILNSPSISINCDEFKFRGTVKCDGECTIRSKKEFDASMFTREGSGKFTMYNSKSRINMYRIAPLALLAIPLIPLFIRLLRSSKSTKKSGKNRA